MILEFSHLSDTVYTDLDEEFSPPLSAFVPYSDELMVRPTRVMRCASNTSSKMHSAGVRKRDFPGKEVFSRATRLQSEAAPEKKTSLFNNSKRKMYKNTQLDPKNDPKCLKN